MRQHKFFGLKRKLITCFMLIVFVMSLICMIVFLSNIVVSDHFNSIYESNTLIIEISNEVRNLEESTERYLSTKSTDFLEAAHESMNSLGLLTYELKGWQPTSKENQMMLDISEMTDRMMAHVNNAFLAKLNRNSELYTEEYQKISRLSVYIQSHCEQLNGILTEVNNRELAEYTNKQITFNILIIIFFGLVCVACVVYIIYQSNIISKPIVQISEAAHAIAMGDFMVADVNCDTNDEVSLMANAFNNMKADIKESMDRLERQRHLEEVLQEEQVNNLKIQAMLKDAEFIALQSQIQPHFLFNTINAGIQIAYSESADETVEFLDNMAGLFRYNLRNMQEAVTLSAEIEQIERYLYLLEKRFKGMFTFSIDVNIPEEICNQIKMPLMILQPLVENSYVHGIREKGTDGKIEVIVTTESGYYTVRIKDNGVGISEANVKKLLRGEKINESAERAKSNGIGIHNVRNRLIFFYDRQNIMKIDSRKNEGTTVTVYLEEVENASFGS